MNPSSKLPKVKYFTWVDWIIDMFEDVLKDQKEVFWYFKFWNIEKNIYDYLRSTYVIKRQKLWINANAIINEDNEFDKSKNLSKAKREDSIVVPEELFSFECCMQVYWNKVAFYSYFQDDLSWVIIENEHVANSQKNLFKMALEYAKILKQK